MEQPETILGIITQLNSTSNEEGFSALRIRLVGQIRNLIANDPDQLFYALYRMDVDETKLRKVLKEQPENDAAEMIATLMIEREVQKLRSRKQSGPRDNNINEEDKW